jgi:hypothetical protein
MVQVRPAWERPGAGLITKAGSAQFRTSLRDDPSVARCVRIESTCARKRFAAARAESDAYAFSPQAARN